MDHVIEILRAAGEPTRLRILALLSQGELAAGELSNVLGQSQPRVSRHLKLLGEAGLVERRPEGAWVFFRLADSGAPARLTQAVLAELSKTGFQHQRDGERLAQVRAHREKQAQAYFESAAVEWETLRRLHQPEGAVEATLLSVAGAGPFQFHVDLGAGTGRVLELFSHLASRSEGVDSSRSMLAMARAKLDEGTGSRVSVRLGNIFDLPYPEGAADLVTLHQVLHYLGEPEVAVREAARILAPGGVLLIADFAPHTFEELRERHAHRRLGFHPDEVRDWLARAGLESIEASKVQADGEGPSLSVIIWRASRPSQSLSSRSAA